MSDELARRPGGGGGGSIVPVGDHEIPADAAARLRELAGAGWADATRRAYRAAWTHFESWCRRQSRQPLPAAPETILLYLDACRRLKSVSALNQRLAAISWAHGLADLPTPASDPRVRQVAKGLRKALAHSPRRVDPITLLELERLLSSIPRGPHIDDLRDRALILVGFYSAMRRSELVAIDVEHLREVPGGLAIFIPKSKTDQEQKGRSVGIAKRKVRCPIEALRAWLAAAKITTGPVFRSLRRGGAVRPQRLSSAAVAEIIQVRCLSAGIVGDFSGHSLRAGLVTQAYRDKLPEAQIIGTTGHKTTAMLARYRREADPIAQGVSAEIGKGMPLEAEEPPSDPTP